MLVDLLLDLDDELVKLLRQRAATLGMSNEEYLRKTLMEEVGLDYAPLESAAPDLMLPLIHLDLRAA